MQGPSAGDIAAAAARLRGHLVATPLVGGVRLPGRRSPVDLRLKLELLQPAGSLYFRGAMHYLIRQLGALKGLVVHGAPRPVLAAATAGLLHRLTVVAFPVGEPDPAVGAMLATVGCDVRPCESADAARAAAEQLRDEEGLRVMPGLDDPDYLAGVATAGTELADELPTPTETVLISPAELAPGLALGMAAAGRQLRVQGVDHEACTVPDDLAHAVRAALRIDPDLPGLAALQWGLEHELGSDPCAVIAV